MKVLMLSNQSRSMAVFWKVLMENMKGHGWTVSCCVPDSGEQLREYGYEVIPYYLDRKGLNPFHDLRTLHDLYKVCSTHQPDIIFATTIKPVIYGCLAGAYARIPHIFATITGLGYVFEADTPIKRVINRVSRSLYRAALARADGIFFQNHEDAQTFQNSQILTPHANMLFARGTGVDINHFSPQPFPSAEEPVFLFIGRLLEAKGLREYAAAAAMLKKEYPKARFQILGVPESGPGSLSIAEIESWHPNIEYLGQTSDVRPFIASSHVAVLPSWREGLPTSLMEAMSMGRPLVCTDVPGCREVLKPGLNGFFAKKQDPQSLAEAMNNFLKQPQLIEKMGKASRQLAEKEFDARIVAKGILNDMRRSMQ